MMIVLADAPKQAIGGQLIKNERQEAKKSRKEIRNKQTFPPCSTQISACPLLTTLLRNAILSAFGAFGALAMAVWRSVKRPTRSAGPFSMASRMMGSKGSEREDSRCGTRRMRCTVPGAGRGFWCVGNVDVDEVDAAGGAC